MRHEINQSKVQETARQSGVLKVPMKEPRKNRKRTGRTIMPITAITLVDSISLQNKFKIKDPNSQHVPSEMDMPQSSIPEEENNNSVLEEIVEDAKQDDTPKLTEDPQPPDEIPIVEEHPINNPPASDPLTLTRQEKTLVDTERNSTLILPVENTDVNDALKPTSEDLQEDKGDEKSLTITEQFETPEDPQDEESEDYGDDYTSSPQEIEEARQKHQARLQVALDIFKAVRSGKLQTLDRNPVAHAKNYLSPNTTEEEAKSLLFESINTGLAYWNRNEWEFTQNSLTEELELVKICQDLRIRPRYNQERTKQEILSHFNLL